MVKEEMEEHLKRAGLDERVAETIRSIANNTCGKGISLGGSNLGDNGAKAVAEALKTNTTLKGIFLENNDILQEGAKAVSEALKSNTTLKWIDLRDNDIGPEGAKAIAEALKSNTTLTNISLHSNNIGPEGAKAVSEALKTNTTLKWIDLRYNNIGPEGAKAVAEALKTNTTLTWINLHYNNIGPEGAKAVAEALKTNTTLKEINLGANDIGPRGAKAIAEVLDPDRDITVLLCGDERKAFDAAREEKRKNPTPSSFLHSTSKAQEGQGASEAGVPATPTLQPPPQALPSSSSSSERIEQLKQQLDSKDAKLKRSQKRVQQLREEAAENQTVIGHQADKLRQTRRALDNANVKTKRQGEELEQKGALIQQLREEQQHVCLPPWHRARIEELKRELKAKNDLEARAENALNLNIPPARFRDKEDATDNDGNPIAGAFASLHISTFAGHRVAMKDIRSVKQRPRLSHLLACRDSVAATTTAFSQRLHREVLILLSIRHPNIVSFLGLSYDAATNTLSFVLSWVEGGSLYEHMHVHKRDLSKAQRARIAMEVAGAMQFLHAHGIVHRDLKSPNVLLDGSLSAKVTDFGLSAFKQGDDKTLTHQKGTPLWASPEQLMDRKLYADTDVFSFGVLYWELCFNCKPWHNGKYKGKGASVADIVIAYKAHEYLPVNEQINGVSLSPAQQQLLDGCFDVQGNRLDFTQLHMALGRHRASAKLHQTLDEQQQAEMLFGRKDDVCKFPPSLLAAVKAVTKELTSRPSVSIALLDLKRHVDTVKKLLTEAGGPTAKQTNPLRPFGEMLAAVAITHDTQKEAAFNGALARNKTRYRGHLTSGNSHPFSPKYKHNTSTKEPTDEEKKQVLRRVTCGTEYGLLDETLLQEDPPLRLQRVFHGVTSWSAVVGILGGGFAALQQLDSGYYGTGIYFTPDLDYALKYSQAFWKSSSTTATMPSELQHLDLDPSKEYRVVLACDVQYGNPYPVLDAKTLKGKPLMPAHDAHVAVKNPQQPNLADALPFASHTQWAQQPDGRRPLAEIVIDDTSCVLVRAVLVFEA